jgi:GntR family transcriptional regulator
MDVRIESNSPMPVHVQLKEQIRFLILNGELEPGTRLPTTRQLAGFLRINRNTVLRVYQDLEKERLVECCRGRGCVVVEKPLAVGPSVSARLLEIIDQAIEQGGQVGISPEDFATFVYARSRQRRDVQVRRRLMFVECGVHVATTLACAIQERLGVEVIPAVLEDLQQPTAEIKEQLREVRIVATTFFHVQELRRLLAKANKEVVALGVKPHLQSLIQVAGIPRGTPTAVVCCSECGALELKQSLEDSGIKGLETVLGGIDNLPGLARLLPGVSVVIASDFVADQVRPLLGPGQQLIALDYTTLDEGAFNLLKSLVTEDLQGA